MILNLCILNGSVLVTCSSRSLLHRQSSAVFPFLCPSLLAITHKFVNYSIFLKFSTLKTGFLLEVMFHMCHMLISKPRTPWFVVCNSLGNEPEMLIMHKGQGRGILLSFSNTKWVFFTYLLLSNWLGLWSRSLKLDTLNLSQPLHTHT